MSELIKKDPLKKTGQIHNLLMCLSFVRCGAGPVLGIVQSRGDESLAADDDTEQIEHSELILPEESAKKFCKVFHNYFDGVCEYLTVRFCSSFAFLCGCVLMSCALFLVMS